MCVCVCVTGDPTAGDCWVHHLRTLYDEWPGKWLPDLALCEHLAFECPRSSNRLCTVAIHTTDLQITPFFLRPDASSDARSNENSYAKSHMLRNHTYFQRKTRASLNSPVFLQFPEKINETSPKKDAPKVRICKTDRDCPDG